MVLGAASALVSASVGATSLGARGSNEPSSEQLFPLVWSGTGLLLDPWAHFGWSFAVGDFNGDGFRDLAVGAPGEFHENGDDVFEGLVHIFNGSSSGLGPSYWIDLRISYCLAGGWICSFGWSLAAGDVNGDGYSDLAVGTSNQIVGLGTASLFLGSRDGLSKSPIWLQSCGVRRTIGGCFWFGWALAMSDVDGDGYADLAVGDPAFNVRSHGISYAVGAVFVYRGSAGGLPDAPDWTSLGDPAFSDSLYGASLSMGDLTGDGLSDLVIGAPHWNTTGRVFAYNGTAGGLSPQPAWTYAADGVPGLYFGDAFGIGDVDGDRYADLAVLRTRDWYLEGAGEVLVFFGEAAGLSNRIGWNAAVPGANGPGWGSPAGSGVAVDDVNGDGLEDMLVGSVGENRTYLFFGARGGFEDSASWVFSNGEEGGYFGSATIIGDVDGSGTAEVFVGAHAWNSGLFPDWPWPDDFSGKAYGYAFVAPIEVTILAPWNLLALGQTMDLTVKVRASGRTLSGASVAVIVTSGLSVGSPTLTTGDDSTATIVVKAIAPGPQSVTVTVSKAGFRAGTAAYAIDVIDLPLSMSMALVSDTTEMMSFEAATIRAKLTDTATTAGVADGQFTILSPAGGNISAVTQLGGGEYEFQWDAPQVGVQTFAQLTVRAKVGGYRDVTNRITILVDPNKTGMGAQLFLIVEPEKFVLSSGETITVSVFVFTIEGFVVRGSGVTLRMLVPIGTLGDVTDRLNGVYTFTYTAPVVTTTTGVSIRIDAAKSTYGTGTTRLGLQIVP